MWWTFEWFLELHFDSLENNDESPTRPQLDLEHNIYKLPLLLNPITYVSSPISNHFNRPETWCAPMMDAILSSNPPPRAHQKQFSGDYWEELEGKILISQLRQMGVDYTKLEFWGWDVLFTSLSLFETIFTSLSF